MNFKVYYYASCNTCKKALNFLDNQGIQYETINIRDKPPTKKELRRMLDIVNGEAKRLFNTSSKEYKAQKLKDKIRLMSDQEVIDLLASNGNLIRRPFVIGPEICMVGYMREIWETKFADN